MVKVKIRYYRVRKTGRGYWIPNAKMKREGFACVPCGVDGIDAWRIAEAQNKKWDTHRRRQKTHPDEEKVAADFNGSDADPMSNRSYPVGTIGYAFKRYRSTDEWSKVKKPRTREDWWRGWAYIEPVFGLCSFPDVELEDISTWRTTISDNVSLREAHRALKIWRALWKAAAAMKYCDRDADPSQAVTNSEPKGRQETWTEGEAVRLVKRAIREGYDGLATIMCIVWDGAVSPVDARTIKAEQLHKDADGTWFDLSRGKTGRDGVITLSRRSERLFWAYMAERFGDSEPIPTMPLFRTRRGAAYRKNSLSEDFRDIRKLEFPGDERYLSDFRRSAGTEAVAGGVSDLQLSAKLANSVAGSKKLEQTYVPVKVGLVRQADAARREGRKILRGTKTAKS